jgi:hypothetical protein
VSNRSESTDPVADGDSATLIEHAAAAARAELRGERDSILGAAWRACVKEYEFCRRLPRSRECASCAAAVPLSLARDVPHG